MNRKLLLSLSVLMLVCGTSFGALLNVNNPSFEGQVQADGTTTKFVNALSWTKTATETRVWMRNPLSSDVLQPTNGANMAYVTFNGSLYQTILPIAENTRYTLTIDLAAATNNPDTGAALTTSIAFGEIGLYANGFNPTSLLTNQRFGKTNPDDTNTEIFTDHFETFSISWDSTASSKIGQTLWITITTGQVWVDNVRLDATVIPEPASMMLLTFGGLMILKKKR
ncbi:MAG: hypothetical protein A2Y10_16400 [Planctomycetes bacterium GWF2_41_51]|nr:MAG: hypothetical protein A2Y10_16400 [Planctomycetes bacterium GWF2_41_51]HBG27901.1 hypothetical protein [Phycisphaerales bacterium]